MWGEHLRKKSPIREGPEQAHAQRNWDVCEQIRGKEGPGEVKGFDLMLK